jgi:hypothetical protein
MIFIQLLQQIPCCCYLIQKFRIFTPHHIPILKPILKNLIQLLFSQSMFLKINFNVIFFVCFIPWSKSFHYFFRSKFHTHLFVHMCYICHVSHPSWYCRPNNILQMYMFTCSCSYICVYHLLTYGTLLVSLKYHRSRTIATSCSWNM